MDDGIIVEVGMIHKLKELGVTNAAVIMLYLCKIGITGISEEK